MLTAIDRQYPSHEDKQRLARQFLARVLEVADEVVEIAGELEAQVRAADLGESYISMLQSVPVMIRLAREAAQQRDWAELNRCLKSIQADGTHGMEFTVVRDMEACERYLGKLHELSSAQSRLNRDIATPDFRNLQEYLEADPDELNRARSEAGYPSGRRLIEWA